MIWLKNKICTTHHGPTLTDSFGNKTYTCFKCDAVRYGEAPRESTPEEIVIQKQRKRLGYQHFRKSEQFELRLRRRGIYYRFFKKVITECK